MLVDVWVCCVWKCECVVCMCVEVWVCCVHVCGSVSVLCICFSKSVCMSVHIWVSTRLHGMSGSPSAKYSFHSGRLYLFLGQCFYVKVTYSSSLLLRTCHVVPYCIVGIFRGGALLRSAFKREKTALHSNPLHICECKSTINHGERTWVKIKFWFFRDTRISVTNLKPTVTDIQLRVHTHILVCAIWSTAVLDVSVGFL